MAGGYYRAGSLWSTIGGIAKGVAGLVTNPIGTIAGAAASLLTKPQTLPSGTLAALPSMQVPTAKQQAQGVVKTGVSPLGTVGVEFRKHRHMNAGNAKAARRAIRRIKSVRHMLVSIERELPRRPAPRRIGSPGVITRAEAARALRA